MLKVLGIESSCDESAAAIVTDNKKILSNVVYSQTAEHLPYKGVVPEIASRSHMSYLHKIIISALAMSNSTLQNIDAIAATGGPGLIGGVIIGTMYGKALSSVLRKPFIAVNHLEGHALTVRLTEKNLDYPYLLLLASGGHCQFIAVLGFKKYQILGQTLDDAVGEAFDKTAKLLNLGYPGGPIIEKLAKTGDKDRYALPTAMSNKEGCDMSFSGLKTAVRNIVEKKSLSNNDINDLCASFQETVARTLTSRAKNAINQFKQISNSKNFVFAGGVAANMHLRKSIMEMLQQFHFNLITPPISLCTDNAAMIAWVGIESLQHGITDSLYFCPKARWNL